MQLWRLAVRYDPYRGR